MDDDLTIPDFLIISAEDRAKAWAGFKFKKPRQQLVEDRNRKAWLKLQKEKQRERLAQLRARKQAEAR